MVLRRVECGEQNSRATSKCLMKYIYIRFVGLAWLWTERKFPCLTETGIPENFSEGPVIWNVFLLHFPLSLNNPALTKGSGNSLKVLCRTENNTLSQKKQLVFNKICSSHAYPDRSELNIYFVAFGVLVRTKVQLFSVFFKVSSFLFAFSCTACPLLLSWVTRIR